MSDYRAVVRHVRFWRGIIHRWSTSYSFTGSGTVPDTAAATLLLHADDAMCYPGSGIVQGTYECEIYRAGGGPPIATYTRFPWETQAGWIAPTGTSWPTPHSLQLETIAEAALLITWPGGISSTGKPVTFRKWWHAVPVQDAGAGSSADITPAQVAALTTGAEALASCLAPGYGLVMGNSSRLAGFAPVVDPFYSNHQMPKGRRRKPLVTASGRYTGPTIQVPNGPIIAD